MEAVNEIVVEVRSWSDPPFAMDHALEGMAIRYQDDGDPLHDVDDARTGSARDRLQRVRSLSLCVHSPCQRCLDRIVDVERIDQLMNLPALCLDTLQVSHGILIQDLIDAAVPER